MTRVGTARPSGADAAGGRAGVRPSVAEVCDLEAVAARSWPAQESAWDGGWLLRATGGWTKRANSALPLDAPDTRPRSIERVERWYADRGLPPTAAVVGAVTPGLPAELARRGWTAGTPTEVMVAELASIASASGRRADLPAVEMSTQPPPGWLGIYRGGRLPQHALDVLRGGDARFLTVQLGGEVVGIGRTVVDPPWVGISAMEVVPAQRGRGLARHLLRAAADRAAASGAERAWLQVENDNLAAIGLYRSSGFVTHHTYRYHQLIDEGDDT